VAVITVLAAVSVAACATPREQPLPLVRIAAAKPVPHAPAEVLVQGFSVTRPPVDTGWPVVDPNVQLGPPPYHVAVVTVPVVHLFDSPTAPTPRLQLPRNTEHGLPRTFLVVAPEGDRWKVLLPI